MIRVRFAPSPTGRLHIGNIFLALNNKLFALAHQGQFLLRLDDTDRERSKVEYENGLKEDLTWLGLSWDHYARQSERDDLYHAAVKKLQASARLYPCYETAEELDLKRKIQRQRGLPPVYDRAALNLTQSERDNFEQQGRKPHWRFKLDPIDVTWDDLVRGPQHVNEASQSDPILVREDGSYLYTLPSVVDDIDLSITHVIRGSDHVTNTATQIQLFQALGAQPPSFAHLPLLVNADGEGLSKRLGSLSIQQLRDAGVEPAAIRSYLAHIGTGDPIVIHYTFADLIKGFDLKKFGKASPRFDEDELWRLNGQYFHDLDYDLIKTKLSNDRIDKNLWDILKKNVINLNEIKEWVEIIYGSINVVDNGDKNFVRQTVDLLPDEPWDTKTWDIWISHVKENTGKKGKDLFMPLRLALTGRTDGPELRHLLPLIGRQKTIKRLCQ
ncbi:MAG: glutamate--tRNA ligase [Alphaproteobacteria bacterium]|nr:glutamate--tRNA ligase [Alphaproteobacteria bacterium]